MRCYLSVRYGFTKNTFRNIEDEFDDIFNKISQTSNVKTYDDHCLIEDLRSKEKISVILKGDEKGVQILRSEKD